MSIAPLHSSPLPTSSNSSNASLPTLVRYLVVTGGASKPYPNPKAGEVAVLDTVSGQWQLIQPAGDSMPPAVQGASLVYINRDANTLTDADYALYLVLTAGAVWKLEREPTAPPSVLACPSLFDLRLCHALLMFFSWNVILPAGAIIARFGRDWLTPADDPELWYKIHRFLQPTGLVLAIGGFVCAILMVPLTPFAALPHSAIGTMVMLLGVLQPINAVLRPHWEPRNCKRIAWEYLHKYSGRIAVIFGLINTFWGLKFILASPAVVVLYSVYFALLVSTVLVLTILGYPTHSSVAQWFRRLHGGCGGRLSYRVPLNPDENDGAKPSASTVSELTPQKTG